MEMIFDVVQPTGAVIKVIGVGGAGCNAVNTMIQSNVGGVEFISVNTDAQSLSMSKAQTSIQLDSRGLGAGSDPSVGRAAAESSTDAIRDKIAGADLLFITAGLGGGTGTGASPVIAKIAKEMDILTVAVVNMPFFTEGMSRMKKAKIGLEELRQNVDSLIVVPNDKLLATLPPESTLRDAFQAADDVLCQAVRGVTGVIQGKGFVNVDFADVRNALRKTGMAMMGIGEASGNPGEGRASEAARKAISNPLVSDISMSGARAVLVNVITPPSRLSISEHSEIMQMVQDYSDENVELKFGISEDPNMEDNALRCIIIATGLSAVDDSDEAASGAATTDMGIDSVLRSGRQARQMPLSTWDFEDPESRERFEEPAILREGK